MQDDKKKRKKYRKIEYGSRKYKKLEAQEALTYLNIHQCQKCWHPVVDGYCCRHCGDSNPSKTWEQEDEYERKIEEKMKRIRP